MNKKGFTLVELVATIVILGVILMIAVPSYTNYIEKSKESKCNADERAILDAAEAFVNDCMFKNECATGKNLTEYVDHTQELEVSDLRDNNFINSDYSKYDVLKIKITGTDIDGITEYKFEIKDASAFESLCK